MFYEDDEYEFEPDSNYYSSEEFVDDYLSFKKKENSYKDIKGFFEERLYTLSDMDYSPGGTYLSDLLALFSKKGTSISLMFAKDYLRSHFYRNDQIIEEGYEYEQIMNNPDVLNLSKFLSKNGEEIIIAENVLNYTKIMFLNDNKITDYDRYQMKYKNKNSDPGDSFDSEVLYWEAVHEGEIDPTQKNSSMTDPQTYFEDLSDVYSYDKYEVLRKYINIIIQSDNLPISMESDIYSSISGYGENKLNKMANIGYKKLINRAFLKFSKLYNLVIDSSRKEQLVLIDKNNVRVLRFHYGSNLADPYFSKSIYFYALNQNGLPSRLYLRFAQRLIKTLNFTLDDQLLCYLEKRFLKNENVSPNYMDKDLRIYTHLGKSVHGNQAELRLGFNLSAYDREGMGGNGSFK